MIDMTLVPDYEKKFWADHYGLCKVHSNRFACTIHHEPPRSLNPDWKTQPETWHLLCDECHQHVHNISRAEAREYLNG